MKTKDERKYAETCRVLADIFGGDYDFANYIVGGIVEALWKASGQNGHPLEVRSMKLTINNFFEHELMQREKRQ